MKQKIRFKGLSLTPDEQAVENGALAMSIGVELHNGSLRPSVVGGTTVTNVDGDIIYIHEISNTTKNVAFTKTVVKRVGTTTTKTITLYWQKMEEDATPVAFGNDVDPGTVTGMVSNGNTLVMMTTVGLRFFLWDNSTYRYLGERPPMIKLVFELAQGTTMLTDICGPSKDLYDEKGSGFLYYDLDKRDAFGSDQYLTSQQRVAALGIITAQSVISDYSDRSTLTTREDACDAALGRTANAISKAGYFYKPFYVRYCYKLWDGRKIMHSAPVLMFTEITYPECVCIFKDRDTDNKQAHCAVVYPGKLKYKCLNSEVYEELQTIWKDIVKSIDIYVTPSISRYDEDAATDIIDLYDGQDISSANYPYEAKWHRLDFVNGTDSDKYFRAKYEGLDSVINSSSHNKWQEASLSVKAAQTMDGHIMVMKYTNGEIPTTGILSRTASTTSLLQYGLFTLQPLSDEEWKKRLLNQNAYYLLSRFTIQEDEAPSSIKTDVKIDSGILANIEAQEAMITDSSPDDYYTHNGIIANVAYLYNGRINLSGITDILYEGFPINMLLGEGDSSWSSKLSLEILKEYTVKSYKNATTGETVNKKTSTTSSIDATAKINAITVGIKTDEGMKYVKTEFDEKTVSLYELATTFLFYPDTRAKEMWLTGTSDSIYFDLQEHPTLNGAYHLGPIGSVSVSSYTRKNLPASTIYDNTLSNKGYIYTSASSNPFVYPAANRYKVGIGEVKAITSVTRAISQGQFGQFPLMAFTTDGIYALEVGSSGSYTSVHPISREVITNTDALLQLDQSVTFITKRGVSQIVSSDVDELSSMLNGVVPNLASQLAITNNLLTSLSDEAKNPIKALQTSKAIYDYSDKRLLFFIKKDGYFTGEILLFSADDSAWTYTIVSEDVKGVFCSYPYPYVHKGNGDLTILDTPYDYTASGTHDGLVITRTLKYDGVRNFISGFFQDYDFDEAKPDLYLWGSNDNRRWYYIGHSNRREQTRIPGHTYKYFRAAVIFTAMKVNDLYHGIELDIKEKFTR